MSTAMKYVVVGGGPAGRVGALALGRAGANVAEPEIPRKEATAPTKSLDRHRAALSHLFTRDRLA